MNLSENNRFSGEYAKPFVVSIVNLKSIKRRTIKDDTDVKTKRRELFASFIKFNTNAA